jgi:cobalamin biosynthesis protein CobW
MTASSAPPVDVVSGFLGSGKTTLLRRLLELGAGRERVAVIVNELGEIGIDGKVIEGLGFAERMVELSSGCICCQLDTAHFEVALEELCDEIRPDRVVIETTGVADPGALSARLGELGHHLGSVITVVDTANLDRVLAEPVGRAQVEAADFFVLSKLDLPDTAGRAVVEKRLGDLNTRAVVVEGPVDASGLTLLFGLGLPGVARTAGAGAAPVEADLDSLAWQSKELLDRRATLALLGRLPAAVYRAKGVLRYAGASVPALVNVTAGRLQSQWEPVLAGEEASTLVFIGRDLAAWRAGLLAALETCIASK